MEIVRRFIMTPAQVKLVQDSFAKVILQQVRA